MNLLAGHVTAVAPGRKYSPAASAKYLRKAVCRMLEWSLRLVCRFEIVRFVLFWPGGHPLAKLWSHRRVVWI